MDATIDSLDATELPVDVGSSPKRPLRLEIDLDRASPDTTPPQQQWTVQAHIKSPVRLCDGCNQFARAAAGAAATVVLADGLLPPPTFGELAP